MRDLKIGTAEGNGLPDFLPTKKGPISNSIKIPSKINPFFNLFFIN